MSSMSSYSESEDQWVSCPLIDEPLLGSSNSSPAQQVPQHAYRLADLLHDIDASEQPILKITVEPQELYKFRYRSEMMKHSHGCLYGVSYVKNENAAKVYPEVELCSYDRKALIKCQLVQFDNMFEHPHRLYVNGEEVTGIPVPQDDSYRVSFPGLCIVHTLSKDVADWLFRGHDSSNFTTEERAAVYTECKSMAKLINLNTVRLKFSAVDPESEMEICSPVFSNPIRNLTNPSTNMLKICRISRHYSQACGGADVIMLVEKVLKKQIAIRFYQWDQPRQMETWSAYGIFSESDVHHQYAISFSTPPYDNQNITRKVKVYVELERKANGAKSRSEPVEFYYTPNPCIQYSKKRKISTLGNSVQSLSIVTGTEYPQTSDTVLEQPVTPKISGSQQILQEPVTPQALYNRLAQHPSTSQVAENEKLQQVTLQQRVTSQVSGNQPTVQQPMIIEVARNQQESQAVTPLDSVNEPTLDVSIAVEAANSQSTLEEFLLVGTNPMLAQNDLMIKGTALSQMDTNSFSLPDFADISEFSGVDFTEYFDYLLESLEEPSFDAHFQGGGPISSDSVIEKQEYRPGDSAFSRKNFVGHVEKRVLPEDKIYIKKMVKEIQSMVKADKIVETSKKITLTKTIEQLLEIRLSNGDTFLHVGVNSKHPLLKYVINLVSDVDLKHLLNLRNAALQTVLHLTIASKQSELIPFLVAKGCDPMLEDLDGNNAFHYAVMFDACLVPLLNAVEEYNVPYDLNAFNNERQVPLHLAVVCSRVEAARRLAGWGGGAGGGRRARDGAGRSALHLAARAHDAPLLHALIDLTPQEDIDEVDRNGYTTLQILCEQPTQQSTYNLVWQLLVEKKADPNFKSKGHNHNAWMLVKDKEIRFEMRKWLNLDGPAKNDDDDEFESADEGEVAVEGALHALTALHL